MRYEVDRSSGRAYVNDRSEQTNRKARHEALLRSRTKYSSRVRKEPKRAANQGSRLRINCAISLLAYVSLYLPSSMKSAATEFLQQDSRKYKEVNANLLRYHALLVIRSFCGQNSVFHEREGNNIAPFKIYCRTFKRSFLQPNNLFRIFR